MATGQQKWRAQAQSEVDSFKSECPASGIFWAQGAVGCGVELELSRRLRTQLLYFRTSRGTQSDSAGTVLLALVILILNPQRHADMWISHLKVKAMLLWQHRLIEHARRTSRQELR